MEHELETNNIKEKLIKWKEKTFSLKNKYSEYKDKIHQLNQLPVVFESVLAFYPLGILFFNFLFLPYVIIFLNKIVSHNISIVLGLIIGLFMLFYSLYEGFTYNIVKKCKQWYLKRSHITSQEKPLKDSLVEIEKEIENLLLNDELMQILKDHKPELDEKESRIFYANFASFKTWIEHKNYPEACKSLGQVLNYLIENEHLFEEKNKLIKHL